MRFSPSSSKRPSPTARTSPFWGFSLAVSGRTRPLAVVSSSSIARTIRRSPRGLSFITYDLRRNEVGISGLALSIGECQPLAREYRSQSRTVKMKRVKSAITAILAALTAVGTAHAAPPRVVTIVMENREATAVLGSGDAPYVTSLAHRYAYARNSFGVTHPSLPNYLAL